MVEHRPSPCALYGQITTQEEAECSGSLCLDVDHYNFCCYWVARSCPTLCSPWSAAHRASFSFTIFESLLKLMSITSMMPSNQLIPCCPLRLPPVFPSIRVFSSESVLLIRWPGIGASASASVLPMNIQGWFALGWTGWILLSKGLFVFFWANK